MKSDIVSHPLVTVHSTSLGKIPPSRKQEKNFSLFLNQNQAFYPGSCTFLTSVLTRVLLRHKKEYKHTIEKQKMPSKKPVGLCPLNL